MIFDELSIKELKSYIDYEKSEIFEFVKTEFEDFSVSFLSYLNEGNIRAASKNKSGNWEVNTWVKEGILALFRHSPLKNYSIDEKFKYFDKEVLPTKELSIKDGIRLVPGGSTIRNGAFIGKGVICMPPMYVNIGAYVDDGTMIDSHALVGTCAQVGKKVHLSAASQIGGVLEPPGAMPVIVEDDVMIGGNCGIYEGVILRNRVVLGSGVILNSSTKVFDIVNEKVVSSEEGKPLEIPAGAVVVPGSRPVNSKFGIDNGLQVATPLIIKYRDDKTDAKTALNFDLR